MAVRQRESRIERAWRHRATNPNFCRDPLAGFMNGELLSGHLNPDPAFVPIRRWYEFHEVCRFVYLRRSANLYATPLTRGTSHS